MGPYCVLGLNGAIGSTDVVHIHWAMCPAALKTLHAGKEGYTSLAFNVTCTHDGRAIHVVPGVYGACNDKTIVRFDEFINQLRFVLVAHYVHCINYVSPSHSSEPLFTDIMYELKLSSTDMELAKGAYVIVDGGYHRWVATMSASRHSSGEDFARLATN